MPSNNQHSSTKFIVGTPLYRQAITSPADVVTFQYDHSCVFVKPAENYQQAVDIAQKEFDQLVNVPRERIGFALDDITHGGRHVRISESAWPAVTAKLTRGTIINIIVRPDPDAKVPPPQYLEIPIPTVPPKDEFAHIRHSSSNPSIRRIPSNSSGHSSKSSTGLFSWIGAGK